MLKHNILNEHNQTNTLQLIYDLLTRESRRWRHEIFNLLAKI